MFDGDKLIFLKAENKVTVQVSSSGYDRERLDAIKEYCRVAIRQEDGSLCLDYEIPAYFKTVTEELFSLKTELERFALAQKMTSIELGENNFKIPYIHPENIVILGGKVKMLHRGIEKLLSPRIYDEEFCLASYKALMVSILVPKVDFELAVSGLDAVKDKIAQDIIPLRTLEEINQYVSEKYYTLSKKSSIENILVNTKKWKGLLIATSVLAVVSAVLSFTTYQSMFKDGPLKSAVIMAQSNFMRKDFSETVESLKAYSVDSLPKEAKYILAASYVRLDSLSDKQKETVLNTITESSDDTILNYWIYLGRGKFEKALDVAQNIGDTQLILHAYTNLYESVRSNVNMNGSEKQKKLSEYEKKIKELSSEIGEKSTDDSCHSKYTSSSKGNGE